MEFFNIVNEMDTFNQLERTIILQYFSFTSLSTVGFGDLTPRSDPERILCAIILLFGVAIFSYMMGIFIDILDEFKSMNQSLAGDAGEQLTLFINLIQKMNNGKRMNEKFKNDIDEYFEYKWDMDRNMCVAVESDRFYLAQLPSEVHE